MQNVLDTVLARIGPNDRVLDLGAWNEVVPRANVVIDLNPYETRHIVDPKTPERFTRDTWIRGDVHSRDLWSRFADKEFDFIICSHFLEDIRDPVFVCEQMNRVGKAGYIECPSRYRECAKLRPNDINSGYDHHRWIVDVIDGAVVVTPKMGWGHAFDYLGDDRRTRLYSWEVQFVALFWKGSFNYYERFPKGNALEAANLLCFYDTVDLTRTPWIFEVENGLLPATAGTCLWVTEYELPVEQHPDFKAYLAQAQALLERGSMTLDTSGAVEGDEAVQREIAVRDARIRACEAHIAALQTGGSWKLVETLRSIRKSAAPTGSMRDRLVQRLNRWGS